nr:PREDICTED: PQ-loop repeat-containing protein 3 isoform X3 [Struthio camelus australis]XP_009680545.1 PREDICTED: PQ-loop repeat-containing protein 3 isoform X4 [Struthio camelus australis]
MWAALNILLNLMVTEIDSRIIVAGTLCSYLFDQFDSRTCTCLEPFGTTERYFKRRKKKFQGAVLSLYAVTLFCVFLFSFLVFLKYQIYYGYPLQTYLEYPIIIAQDIILFLFILHFSGNMKQALLYTVTFVGGWCMLTLQKWIIDLAMNLCTLISAASKLAQLQCLWQTKDSGQVSALTWSMSAYTCATRIITTLMTTNDLIVRAEQMVL